DLYLFVIKNLHYFYIIIFGIKIIKPTRIAFITAINTKLALISFISFAFTLFSGFKYSISLSITLLINSVIITNDIANKTNNHSHILICKNKLTIITITVINK